MRALISTWWPGMRDDTQVHVPARAGGHAELVTLDRRQVAIGLCRTYLQLPGAVPPAIQTLCSQCVALLVAGDDPTGASPAGCA